MSLMVAQSIDVLVALSAVGVGAINEDGWGWWWGTTSSRVHERRVRFTLRGRWGTAGFCPDPLPVPIFNVVRDQAEVQVCRGFVFPFPRGQRRGTVGRFYLLYSEKRRRRSAVVDEVHAASPALCMDGCSSSSYTTSSASVLRQASDFGRGSWLNAEALSHAHSDPFPSASSTWQLWVTGGRLAKPEQKMRNMIRMNISTLNHWD